MSLAPPHTQSSIEPARRSTRCGGLENSCCHMGKNGKMLEKINSIMPLIPASVGEEREVLGHQGPTVTVAQACTRVR